MVGRGTSAREGTVAERDAIAAARLGPVRRGRRRGAAAAVRSAARARRAGAVRPADDRRADRHSSTSTTRSAPCSRRSSSRSLTGRSTRAAPSACCAWHALSGYSLALTQYTGGRVTLADGTGALLRAIARRRPSRRGSRHRWRPSRPPRRRRGADPRRRDLQARGRGGRGAAQHARRDRVRARAVGGQAGGDRAGPGSRGVKIFIRARGADYAQNAIRPGHPFGYLDTEILLDDGTQLHDRLRRRRGPVRRGRPASGAARARRDPARLRGSSPRPPTTGSPTSTRGARGRSTVPAGTRATMPRCAAPRAACCSPAPTSRTAGPGFIDGAIESGLETGARAAALV